MHVVRAVGLRPVLRATCAGLAAALLTLLVLLRDLFEVLDPSRPRWRRSAPER